MLSKYGFAARLERKGYVKCLYRRKMATRCIKGGAAIRMMSGIELAAHFCAGLLLIVAESPAAEPDGLEFFEMKIRPLLVDHCFQCHTEKKKGNLRLDSRETILKGGDTGPAVVPGQPEKSLLVKAIGYKDAELRMPPKSK